MQQDDVISRSILEYMHSGVLTVDLAGRITNFNPAAAQILGLVPEQVMGRSFAECFFEDPHNEGFTEAFVDAIYHAEAAHSRDITYYCAGSIRHLSLTTSLMWDQASDPARRLGVIAVFADITERKNAEDELRILNAELEQRVQERTRTLELANRRLEAEVEQRRRAEAQLRHLSQHDLLTGLPNRGLFQEQLQLSIARYHAEEGEGPIVLYFDLDGFKLVNDRQGHAVGDWLLQQVARRIEGCLREGDLVARMGGDEFTALLTGGIQQAQIEEVLQRMFAAIANPFVTDGGEQARVGLSIGVAHCPEHGEEAEALIRCADQAMYEAKKAGRGCWRFYDPKM